jgi:hypothetical protein
MGGMHKYNEVMLGAPRGSFTALANYHPSTTQPSVRCLTPWLGWFGPVENRTVTSVRHKESIFAGRVPSDGYSERDTY